MTCEQLRDAIGYGADDAGDLAAILMAVLRRVELLTARVKLIESGRPPDAGAIVLAAIKRDAAIGNKTDNLILRFSNTLSRAMTLSPRLSLQVALGAVEDFLAELEKIADRIPAGRPGNDGGDAQ